eukprot:TRINITY_DN971_c0_g1_i3.p1 TRINITY_DN971_c0_g1~~TRINITY_DN971_c0_g1_i3.p1  ORF type:complete len:820 (-),score=334.37 TRINITY_DN971_c0_g1_i3:103-2265(-)
MNPQDSSNAIQHDEVFRNTNSTSEETTSTVSTDSLSTRKGKGKGKAKASLSEQLSEDYGGQFDGVEVTDEDEDIELPDGMFVDDSLTELGSEDDEGNVEFKLYLKPSQSRFERLVTQMKFRLMEGSGEAIYEIGVEDNGHVHGLDDDELDSSIATLEAMAEQLAAEVTIIKRRKGDHGQSAVCMVRRLVAAGESCVDLRIAVAGNVDSGKSTLIGVLVGGKLDNGRGLARSQVFNHPHEIETGRTSSISHQILGFDGAGEITNYSNLHNYSWAEIVAQSSKVLSFIDLAGHKKYLKTTISGLTGHVPDYCMLMMAANDGLTRMTKEHLGIALAMKIPVMCVVTKIDICPKHVFQANLKLLVKVLKSPGADKKMPVIVKNQDDVIKYAKEICNNRVVPIFLVSNVTGENLDLLREFMNLVPARREWERRISQPPEFYVTDDFYVTGVGTVVSGILTSGTVKVNDTLWLGPNGTGDFTKATVKSIHYQRMAVKKATAGQSCCFALKKVKRSAIRRGMVMLGAEHENVASHVDFEAEVLILHHSTTIRLGYQPVVHSGTVRQAASIVGMDKVCLRTGDKTRVRFRFTNRPEYLKMGEPIVFCEGRTRGIGKITALGTGNELNFEHVLLNEGEKGQRRIVNKNGDEEDQTEDDLEVKDQIGSSSSSSSSSSKNEEKGAKSAKSEKTTSKSTGKKKKKDTGGNTQFASTNSTTGKKKNSKRKDDK